MNPGGIRNALTYRAGSGGGADGISTYGDAFAVQPFGNILQIVDVDGAQIWGLLRQQFLGCDAGPGFPGSAVQSQYSKILQISNGFAFTVSSTATQRLQAAATFSAADCNGAIEAVSLNGTPVANDTSTTFRVVTNNFLAAGGDNFSSLKQPIVTGVGQDLDAFVDHLKANSDETGNPPAQRIAPPAANRITFVAPPPVVPEVPWAALLPLTALALGAVTVVIGRRREHTTSTR